MQAVGGVTGSGGVVYTYRLNSSSGAWFEEASLFPSDRSAGDSFGFSISLYRDLSQSLEAVLLLAGAPNVSAAYVMFFDPRVSLWIENSKLTSSLSSDQYGYSVSAYEGTLAVGAPSGSDGKGGVYVYGGFNNSNRVGWYLESQVRMTMMALAFFSSVAFLVYFALHVCFVVLCLYPSCICSVLVFGVMTVFDCIALY